MAYSVTKSTSVVTVYHQDGLGSTRALTDSGGNVTQTYAQSMWGTGQSSTGQPFQWTGQQFDPETGFTFLRARSYLSSIGRFTSRDSFPGVKRSPTSLNRYIYAANNPVNFTDPSGRVTIGLCFSGSVAAFGRYGTGSLCPIVFAGTNQMGGTFTLGGGTSTGFGASLGAGPQVSTGNSIADLTGGSLTFGGSVSPGDDVAGADVSVSPTAVSVTGEFGPGAKISAPFGMPVLPGEGHVAATYTRGVSYTPEEVDHYQEPPYNPERDTTT